MAKHSGIIQYLIAANEVSGYDTVWLSLWYHQDEVVKALPAGIALNYLGDPKASLDDVVKESTHFTSACYAQKTYPPDTMH